MKNGYPRWWTHGLSKTPTYQVWAQMWQRCTNPRNPEYKNYGGRGIRVCRRWEKFENFYADMGMKPKRRFIDRRNNDGNYTPSNCRWATRMIQASNTRSNRRISHNGSLAHLQEWSRRTGLSSGGIRNRLDSGWSAPAALTKPRYRSITYLGKTMTVAEWGRALGVSSHTLTWRINAGWPLNMIFSKKLFQGQKHLMRGPQYMVAPLTKKGPQQ